MMSTIQNIKNFIRHGKQARVPEPEPSTNVSHVHAHGQQAVPKGQAAGYGITEPNLHAQQPQQGQAAYHADFSTAALDNKNVAARAGDVAAKLQGEHQKKGGSRSRDVDQSVLERIVAEERESRGKLPRYPGLERWILLEKMGDGAFSNVYRAKDTQGQYPECAIKVVRKFEMNSSQVSWHSGRCQEAFFSSINDFVMFSSP